MDIYIYVHMYEEFFSKTWFPNMALPLQPRFLDWRLTRFRKELLTLDWKAMSIIPDLAVLSWRHCCESDSLPKQLVRITRIICTVLCLTPLFLEFYILATTKVTSGRVLTCDNAQWLNGTAPMRIQATSAITWYPTQPHYLDTELTSPCPILIMLSSWLESDQYQF